MPSADVSNKKVNTYRLEFEPRLHFFFYLRYCSISFQVSMRCAIPYFATFFSPHPGIVAKAVSHFLRENISSISLKASKSTNSLTYTFREVAKSYRCSAQSFNVKAML